MDLPWDICDIADEYVGLYQETISWVYVHILLL